MTDNTDYETIDNTERGCGHLKHSKAYVQSPPESALGTLPKFVEFEPPVPFYEDHFRGYEYFPGIAFESAATPSMAEWYDTPENDVDTSCAMDPDALRDFPTEVDVLSGYGASDVSEEALTATDPRVEIHRHLERVDREAPDATDVGSMTQANSHDLIMWVGETYYPEPQDFIDEVHEQGLNKAIPTSQNHEPPTINPGATRLFLIHPNAVEAGHDDDGEPQYVAGLIGYSYLWRTVVTENENGEWASWQQDLADADKVDLVRIGDETVAEDETDENGCCLDDFADDESEDEADSEPSVDDLEEEIIKEAEDLVEEMDDGPQEGTYDGVVGYSSNADGIAALLLSRNGKATSEHMVELERVPPDARSGGAPLRVDLVDGDVESVTKMPETANVTAEEIKEAFRGDL